MMLHQITLLSIFLILCQRLCIFTHMAPSQKKEIVYEKKCDLSAQNDAQSAVSGFSSSSTNIVMMIANIASVNAVSLSLLIFQSPFLLRIGKLDVVA